MKINRNISGKLYFSTSGSNLLQTLTMPCNITLTQSYETQRNLLIGMDYHRSSTLVTQRSYSYDTRGRRVTRKVTTNGNITLHQRFLYRGYLKIACCDLTRSDHPALWYITWESPRGRAGNEVPASQPSQPVATRLLVIQKDGTWYRAKNQISFFTHLDRITQGAAEIEKFT